MGAFSLEKFRRELPSQYINVGVAEQNLVSVAAGLALGGKKVIIYTIASFITQRSYEQVKIDLCSMHLPVVIVGVGAGITYGSDGHTHHALQDIAIMRALPGITILNPSDPVMSAASALIGMTNNGPTYVRIDKGRIPIIYEKSERFAEGMALLRKGKDVTIVTTGLMVHQALALAEELSGCGIEAGVIDLYRLKPIYGDLLVKFLKSTSRVVTLEEHSIIGGLGSIVCEILSDACLKMPVKRVAVADKNLERYGSREWMHACYKLDSKAIYDACING